MSENSDQIEWYIARDGNQHGPLSQDELDKFIEFGHLKPTDLLWRAGFSEWRRASDVFQGPPPAEMNAPPEPDGPAAARQASPHEPRGDDGRGEPAHGPAPAARTSGRGHASQPAATEQPADRAAASKGQEEARQPRSFADRWQQVEQRAQREPRDVRLSAGAPHGPAAHAGRPARDAFRQGVDHEEDFDYDDDYEDEGRPSSWLAIAATVLILGLIGAGGWFAYNNQDEIAALYSDIMSAGKSDNNDIAIVRAPEAASRSAIGDGPGGGQARTGNGQSASPASMPSEPRPATASIAPSRSISGDLEGLSGVPILKSDAWAFAEREFPAWTTKQLDNARAAAAAGQPQEAINGELVDAFVAFRRDNAALALLASPKSLEGVATAFVGSLKALTAKGPEGCYAFISSGEGTDKLASVYFEPGIEEKIDAQMLAIMRAIVEAKSKPIERSPPKEEDFEKLSGELTERGWSDADLKLFSNPDALSRAKPEVVCRLVTEWFSAQTELADAEARDRLIAASLRPVIGG
jgi:hypothetical protein